MFLFNSKYYLVSFSERDYLKYHAYYVLFDRFHRVVYRCIGLNMMNNYIISHKLDKSKIVIPKMTYKTLLDDYVTFESEVFRI